ncbi:copper resistance protein CopD [Rhodococcus hoagii]|nr:copper resistance protein CopD [Prescottella equi]
MSVKAESRPRGHERRRYVAHILGWGVTAALTAAALTQLSASEALFLLGLPNPGSLTVYGLPALMALGEVSAIVMVGSLLLATVLVPPQLSGVLDVDGYLAVRTAGFAAAIWALCAALLVPLSLSDSSGQPLSFVFADPGPFIRAIADLDVPRAWAWTALVSIAVAVMCRITLRHKWTPLLLVLAVVALMPRALSGHSASGGSHDIATNSLVFHLVAAAVWMGGLIALVLHVRRGGDHLDIAVCRFSSVALWTFAIMAASGMINAVVRIPLTSLVTGTYGLLLLTKVAALVLVGFAGWRQRRIAVKALQADPHDRREFMRLAVTETIVLALTVGIAVALGRTPPPAPSRRTNPSAVEERLGYTLDGPPTVARLAFDWRFDLFFGTAAVLLAVCYMFGVRRLQVRRRQAWPWTRTASWLTGCVVLMIATSSGIGRFAPAVFSVHVVAISALAFIAPLALTLGAPLTLAKSVLQDSDNPADVPGTRQWLRDIYRSALVRFCTRPAVAWSLLVAGFYGYYLGGAFASTSGSHVVHVLANGYFLMSGLLFFWTVTGADPTPGHPLILRGRLVLIGTAAGAYVIFTLVLVKADSPLAGQYFTSLQRGWFDDLNSDQRLGAIIGLAIALAAFSIAAVAAYRFSEAARRRTHPFASMHLQVGAPPAAD